MAIDAAGHLFLAGQQTSPDFPSTGSISGLPPTGSGGGFFIAELSANGSSLVFSDTFNMGFMSIAQIALDAQGNVYVAGTTDGTVFPTTPGAYLHTRPGASLDGFVFLLNPAAGSLVFSTLLGGSNLDHLTALAIDSAGGIAVVGYSAAADTRAAFEWKKAVVFPSAPKQQYSDLCN